MAAQTVPTTGAAAAPGAAWALEIDRVSKVYPGVARGRAVQAVDDVDIRVRRGEFLSLVGPSGCGKSTLLKIVAGLLRPTMGAVRVDGWEVQGPLQDVGMVFQEPVLLRWRTALANVLLPLELMGVDTGPHVAWAGQLLEQVGLAGFEEHKPDELSGGMQQRVAICRALVNRPALLLMDEPFSALDELTREHLNDELLELWRRYEKTVLYVTHSVSEAVYLSDRVVVLSDRPARLLDLVDVPLPRPRTPELRYHPDYVDTVRRIREQLRA